MPKFRNYRLLGSKLTLSNSMRKVAKGIAILLGVCILFFHRPVPVSGAGGIDLDFTNQRLSANITGAKLRAVIERIRKEKGVWFKLWFGGRESLLDEKVSVQFKGLPVQDGLERIFSGMNHSIIFDEHGKLVGVFLLGKPSRKRIRGRRWTVAPRRAPRRKRRQ